MTWHEQLHVHTSTHDTVVAFLRATSPTPVYGAETFQFKFPFPATQAKKLPNQLRVALARIRKKVKNRGVQVSPFVMIVQQPEEHTIAGETFCVFTLQRRLGQSNPFLGVVDGVDAMTVLAIADRNHPPTKMITQLLQQLSTEYDTEIEATNWNELTSMVWLCAHGYAEPVPHEYMKNEIKLSGSECSQINLHFRPIIKHNHINNPVTTSPKET